MKRVGVAAWLNHGEGSSVSSRLVFTRPHRRYASLRQDRAGFRGQQKSIYIPRGSYDVKPAYCRLIQAIAA
jgi:hypothetical protein